MAKYRPIRANAKPKQVIAMSAPVTITAAESEGEAKGPAKFDATFYTGGALEINGWDLPVVVDLSGLSNGNVLVANLDHDSTKRVGNFSVSNDGKTLVAHGTATAKTAARDEVVGSAAGGYQWQASLEVNPRQVEEVKAGKKVTVNGQELTGPLYVTRKGTLKGFAFVSHGADDNTTVSIAAIAASPKEHDMDPKLQAWIEAMGFDVETLTPDQLAGLKANYEGKAGTTKPVKAASNPFEARRIEAQRQQDIREIADKFIERRPNDIEFINACEKMVDHAIETKMEARDFRAEMYESSMPLSHTVPQPRERSGGVTNRILEAAVCQAGRLGNLEKAFSEQELEAARKRYPNGIGLNQLVLECADANGYRGRGRDVTIDAQRAAFGLSSPNQIRGQGWSTIEISSIISNVANKFIMEGWNTVDMTAMRLAAVKPVRDFKQITTVSLWGDTEFEKLGAAGEIKHGTLGEVVYTGKADTYAKMLAITRQDYINDDLGALTAAPRKLGRGGGLKLNDIFWTALLGGESAGFFSATHTDLGNTGNSNFNTGAADATIAGLTATELLFLNQVGPDGKPAGIEPAIVLVPTALKATMAALLDPQSRLITGASSTLSDVNVYAGRFRLESSPYMHNTAYTGYSSSAWYMMADPNVMATIEIQALFGRVEPTIESADSDFNTLGVQMRGYSDIGCSRQEFRACVKADGGSS
jgi:hypothetical protein